MDTRKRKGMPYARGGATGEGSVSDIGHQADLCANDVAAVKVEEYIERLEQLVITGNGERTVYIDKKDQLLRSVRGVCMIGAPYKDPEDEKFKITVRELHSLMKNRGFFKNYNILIFSEFSNGISVLESIEVVGRNVFLKSRRPVR